MTLIQRMEMLFRSSSKNNQPFTPTDWDRQLATVAEERIDGVERTLARFSERVVELEKKLDRLTSQGRGDVA